MRKKRQVCKPAQGTYTTMRLKGCETLERTGLPSVTFKEVTKERKAYTKATKLKRKIFRQGGLKRRWVDYKAFFHLGMRYRVYLIYIYDSKVPIGCFTIDTRESKSSQVYWKLFNFGILPKYQRKGFGTAVLHEVKKKVGSLELRVDVKEAQGRSFYKSLGFKTIAKKKK